MSASPEREAAEGPYSDTQSSVRVAVRIRPLLEHESSHPTEMLHLDATGKRVVTGRQDSRMSKEYGFDAVLGPDATQDDVAEAVGLDQLLQRVLQGYNGTVFAYGQTGSGKTHTMEGLGYGSSVDGTAAAEPDPGLIPRAIVDLFDAASREASANSRQILITCSFVQIYMEQCYDLLGPSAGAAGIVSADNVFDEAFNRGPKLRQGLRLRWSKDDGFYLENIYRVECMDAADALSHFERGVRNRITASHRMNRYSSRSHCLFTLELSSSPIGHPEEVIRSKLVMVDLAGSEKQAQTGATSGLTQKESISINQSLMTLRKVISGLAEGEKRPHIPFRDSKLTSLLQPSLGGSSFTSMVACVSPSDLYHDDNVSTLDYASLAQRITNRVVRNEDPRARLIRQLREQVTFLQSQIALIKPLLPSETALDQLLPPPIDPAPRRSSTDGSTRNDGGPSRALRSFPSLVKDSPRKSVAADPDIDPPTPTGPRLPRRASSFSARSLQAMPSLPRARGSGKDGKDGGSASRSVGRKTPVPGSGRPPSGSSVVSSMEGGGGLFENRGDHLERVTEDAEGEKDAQGQRVDGQQGREALEALAHKLVAAVAVVRGLQQANARLREEYTRATQRAEELEETNGAVHRENEHLRERVEMLEGVVVMDAAGVAAAQGAAEQAGTSGDVAAARRGLHTTSTAMLVELVDLRRENEVLRQQLRAAGGQPVATVAGIEARSGRASVPPGAAAAAIGRVLRSARSARTDVTDASSTASSVHLVPRAASRLPSRHAARGPAPLPALASLSASPLELSRRTASEADTGHSAGPSATATGSVPTTGTLSVGQLRDLVVALKSKRDRESTQEREAEAGRGAATAGASTSAPLPSLTETQRVSPAVASLRLGVVGEDSKATVSSSLPGTAVPSLAAAGHAPKWHGGPVTGWVAKGATPPPDGTRDAPPGWRRSQSHSPDGAVTMRGGLGGASPQSPALGAQRSKGTSVDLGRALMRGASEIYDRRAPGSPAGSTGGFSHAGGRKGGAEARPGGKAAEGESGTDGQETGSESHGIAVKVRDSDGTERVEASGRPSSHNSAQGSNSDPTGSPGQGDSGEASGMGTAEDAARKLEEIMAKKNAMMRTRARVATIV